MKSKGTQRGAAGVVSTLGCSAPLEMAAALPFGGKFHHDGAPAGRHHLLPTKRSLILPLTHNRDCRIVVHLSGVGS